MAFKKAKFCEKEISIETNENYIFISNDIALLLIEKKDEKKESNVVRYGIFASQIVGAGWITELATRAMKGENIDFEKKHLMLEYENFMEIVNEALNKE